MLNLSIPRSFHHRYRKGEMWDQKRITCCLKLNQYDINFSLFRLSLNYSFQNNYNNDLYEKGSKMYHNKRRFVLWILN